MTFKEAKHIAHARSSIFRKSKCVRFIKHHTTPLDERVPKGDQLATDWEEYDPREHSNCLWFMYAD